MGIKFTFNKEIIIKTSVQCPSCNQKTEAKAHYGDEYFVGNCTRCGNSYRIPVPDIQDETGSPVGPDDKNPVSGSEDGIIRYALAKQISNAINIAGGLILVWALFFPLPYVAVILVSMLFVPVVIAVVRLSGGIIHTESIGNQAVPHMTYAFIAGCSAVAVRALFDFNLLEWDHVWKFAVIAAIPVAWLIYISDRHILQNKWRMLIVIPFVLLYTYGAVIEINCLPDKSAPVPYLTTVTDKRVSNSSKGGHSYYYRVTQWNPKYDTSEISVTYKIYDTIEIGDKVRITERAGLLGIPWYKAEFVD